MFAIITEQEIRGKQYVVLAFCLVTICVFRIDTVGHFVAGMFQSAVFA
jgi:hypothetical protein